MLKAFDYNFQSIKVTKDWFHIFHALIQVQFYNELAEMRNVTMHNTEHGLTIIS